MAICDSATLPDFSRLSPPGYSLGMAWVSVVTHSDGVNLYIYINKLVGLLTSSYRLEKFSLIFLTNCTIVLSVLRLIIATSNFFFLLSRITISTFGMMKLVARKLNQTLTANFNKTGRLIWIATYREP